jgi:hypothetical protein
VEGVPARIGPRDPCPCGSGRRYEKCHQDRDISVFPTGPNSAMVRLTPDGVRRQYPQFWEQERRESKARGIAPGLVKLLSSTTKGEQVRAAKHLEVSQIQFVDLIRLAADELSFQYSLHRADHVPAHLRRRSQMLSWPSARREKYREGRH